GHCPYRVVWQTMIAGPTASTDLPYCISLRHPIKGKHMAVLGTTEPEGDELPVPMPSSPLVRAAQKLVAGIEGLSAQVAERRAENAALRREVRDAVSLIEHAGAAAESAAP